MQMTFAATEKGRTMATKIVRDNCKDCISGCEHAGKDREFVCVKGVSCKTVKPKPETVAVVRCKDCRLGEPDMIVNGYKDDFWCNYYDHTKPADGFCEKGKRRTNEQ